jgi:hypothetical protein
VSSVFGAERSENEGEEEEEENKFLLALLLPPLLLPPFLPTPRNIPSLSTSFLFIFPIDSVCRRVPESGFRKIAFDCSFLFLQPKISADGVHGENLTSSSKTSFFLFEESKKGRRL